jgi:hypothetical protein
VGGDGQRGVRPRRTLLSPQWCFGCVLCTQRYWRKKIPLNEKDEKSNMLSVMLVVCRLPAILV